MIARWRLETRSAARKTVRRGPVAGRRDRARRCDAAGGLRARRRPVAAARRRRASTPARGRAWRCAGRAGARRRSPARRHRAGAARGAQRAGAGGCPRSCCATRCAARAGVGRGSRAGSRGRQESGPIAGAPCSVVEALFHARRGPARSGARRPPLVERLATCDSDIGRGASIAMRARGELDGAMRADAPAPGARARPRRSAAPTWRVLLAAEGERARRVRRAGRAGRRATRRPAAARAAGRRRGRRPADGGRRAARLATALARAARPPRGARARRARSAAAAAGRPSGWTAARSSAPSGGGAQLRRARRAGPATARSRGVFADGADDDPDARDRARARARTPSIAGARSGPRGRGDPDAAHAQAGRHTREPEEIAGKETSRRADLADRRLRRVGDAGDQGGVGRVRAGFLGERFYFQSFDAPLDRSELVLVTPAGMPLDVDRRAGAPPTPRRALAPDGASSPTFAARKVPQLFAERSAVPAIEYVPSVRVSSGVSWQGWARFVDEQLSARRSSSRALRDRGRVARREAARGAAGAATARGCAAADRRLGHRQHRGGGRSARSRPRRRWRAGAATGWR